MNIQIEGKAYSVQEDTKLGDHLYHREGNYFIDTEEKFNVVKQAMEDCKTYAQEEQALDLNEPVKLNSDFEHQMRKNVQELEEEMMQNHY